MDTHILNQIPSLNANNFRDLRINIEYQLQHKKENLVVVTSSNQGEGKSYCALNIALSYAEANKKVLLIDFDLHRPKLSKDLAYGQTGISAIYYDEISPKECIMQLNNNLDFIPSGYVSINPSEIVASQSVRKELHNLTKEYDIVIVDSPPIRLSPDTKIIISQYKNVLFVVGANKTRDYEVKEAFEKMKLINPNILGIILNMKKFSKKEKRTYEYK